MNMRVVGASEAWAWLPVINEQIRVVMVDQAVLVHTRRHPPLPRIGIDNHEDMGNVEEKPTWPAGHRPQRDGLRKGGGGGLIGRVRVRGNIEALRRHTAGDEP